ncbi:MAG: cereblon family protein [Magnetococcus sp. DMHC-1]|nr:hypothetical protein [Magnetococcales bacterium]
MEALLLGDFPSPVAGRYFRQVTVDGVDAVLVPEERDATALHPVRWVLCARCAHRVTRPEMGLRERGRHEHIFFNPQGLVFQIRCYFSAPGCLVVGMPTGDFSWFKGYLWQYAHCGGCHHHLGWYYLNGPDVPFFGLIVNRLKYPLPRQ